MNDIKNKLTFTIKDVIYIVSLIITGLSIYFTMKTNIDIVTKQVNQNTKTLQENNLQLINYKLDQVLIALEKIK